MVMTRYEEEVARLSALVLRALREEAAPEAAGRLLVRLAFPDAVAGLSAGSDGADTEMADADAAAFKALTQQQQEQLTNAIHAAVAQLLVEAKAAGEPAMAYRLGGAAGAPAAVAQLLDAVLWLARQRVPPVDPALASHLLEQVTECASNADCEGLFAYLDARTGTFKAPPFQSQATKLTLLRTCNTLLKRLSKSANAMLCGRVLLFLAKLLPLTERSGVNLGGAFNTDNTTPVEEVQEGAVDCEGKPVDPAFYRTFWGLQSFFSTPPSALQSGKWGEVSRDIRRVLERFRKEQVTVGESPAGAGGGGGDGQGASVKYLSSSRLMGLQLRDASFRRHFLLQCLILMQWCERPRQKDRAGLRGKLLEDVQDLRAKVYAELEATPDMGPQFAAAIRHLVQWEDSWAAWKHQSCPAAPMERPPAAAPNGADTADITAPAPKRRKLGSDAIFGARVGTQELDRLWNLTEDNLSALPADDRGGFKTVRQLVEPIIDEMQEAAEGEEDVIRASRSKLYSWKTLRAVARVNLQAFASAVQKGGDLEVAARALYPAECPPPPAAKEPPAAAAASGGDVEAAVAAADAAADAATAAPEAGAGAGEGVEEEGAAAEQAEAGAAEEEEGELLEDGEALEDAVLEEIALEEAAGLLEEGEQGGAAPMDAAAE